MSRVRRKHSDYKNPYGKAQLKVPEKDNMGNVTILAIIVLFLSSIYTVQNFMSIELSVLGLLKIFCFFVAITFLIPIKVYRKWLTISMYEYIIFNVISLAPLFCASFFILNNTFASEPYSETYKVIDLEVKRGNSYYILANKQYEEKEYIRCINPSDEFIVNGSDSLKITFTDGLFGIRIIDQKELK